MTALFLSMLLLGGGGSGGGVSHCTPDREAACLHCNADNPVALPACVPSGQGYLPTPSPCVAVVGGQAVRVTMLVPQPKPLKPGKWPLQDFYADKRKRRGWVKWVVLAVLL